MDRVVEECSTKAPSGVILALYSVSLSSFLSELHSLHPLNSDKRTSLVQELSGHCDPANWNTMSGWMKLKWIEHFQYHCLNDAKALVPVPKKGLTQCFE